MLAEPRGERVLPADGAARPTPRTGGNRGHRRIAREADRIRPRLRAGPDLADAAADDPSPSRSQSQPAQRLQGSVRSDRRAEDELVTMAAGHTAMLEQPRARRSGGGRRDRLVQGSTWAELVAHPEGEHSMSVEENKALIRTYFDTIWNKGQFEREPEFVALDVVVHAPPIPGIPMASTVRSRSSATFRKALPDLHLTQDVIFGGEDKVVQVWTTRGTHTGRSPVRIPRGRDRARPDRGEHLPHRERPDRRALGHDGPDRPDAAARRRADRAGRDARPAQGLVHVGRPSSAPLHRQRRRRPVTPGRGEPRQPVPQRVARGPQPGDHRRDLCARLRHLRQAHPAGPEVRARGLQVLRRVPVRRVSRHGHRARHGGHRRGRRVPDDLLDVAWHALGSDGADPDHRQEGRPQRDRRVPRREWEDPGALSRHRTRCR